ncbi:hypothetical protein EVAR_5664_1 [Eumeta japonica]|uniref:Uncharacterized protein n=1 Tax=Eumeta variegata TaxID=151549 RepID=A0A4C1TAL6_EUMVA|nr:hypothetical protein EVAR_5664_1 [Eumeta japonica]
MSQSAARKSPGVFLLSSRISPSLSSISFTTSHRHGDKDLACDRAPMSAGAGPHVGVSIEYYENNDVNLRRKSSFMKRKYFLFVLTSDVVEYSIVRQERQGAPTQRTDCPRKRLGDYTPPKVSILALSALSYLLPSPTFPLRYLTPRNEPHWRVVLEFQN